MPVLFDVFCLFKSVISILISCPFSFTTDLKSYHHCLCGMFTITAYQGVKVIMSYLDVKLILNIVVTTDLDTGLFAYLFILYSCSSLHHPNQLVHLSTCPCPAPLKSKL